MSELRTISHAKPELELKVASKALVRAAGGTDGAAETVGGRQQRMSDVGLPNTRDFLRVDEVGRLEDVTVGAVGHPHVTRALAKRQGYALVRLPDARPDAGDVLALLADLSAENGDIAQKILLAVSGAGEGGHAITPAEAAGILGEIDDQLAVSMAMRAHIAAIAEG